jgi:hypothetical protein
MGITQKLLYQVSIFRYDSSALYGLTLNSGKPPAWTPIKEHQKLKQDSGDFYRDVNAAHYPPYPTQPAVEAVLKQTRIS